MAFHRSSRTVSDVVVIIVNCPQVISLSSFLASTHYTNYNPWLFAINLTALIIVLIPKLPQVRVHVLILWSLMTFSNIAASAKSALYG